MREALNMQKFPNYDVYGDEGISVQYCPGPTGIFFDSAEVHAQNPCMGDITGTEITMQEVRGFRQVIHVKCLAGDVFTGTVMGDS